MDHNAYPESLMTKTWAELQWIAKDAQTFLKVFPDNPNAGYYQDEINYCANEIQIRKDLGVYSPRKFR